VKKVKLVKPLHVAKGFPTVPRTDIKVTAKAAATVREKQENPSLLAPASAEKECTPDSSFYPTPPDAATPAAPPPTVLPTTPPPKTYMPYMSPEDLANRGDVYDPYMSELGFTKLSQGDDACVVQQSLRIDTKMEFGVFKLIKHIMLKSFIMEQFKADELGIDFGSYKVTPAGRHAFWQRFNTVYTAPESKRRDTLKGVYTATVPVPVFTNFMHKVEGKVFSINSVHNSKISTALVASARNIAKNEKEFDRLRQLAIKLPNSDVVISGGDVIEYTLFYMIQKKFTQGIFESMVISPSGVPINQKLGASTDTPSK
jgi:hypothetical protein